MGPRLVSKKDHSEKTGLGAFVFYPGERPIRPTEAPFWLLDFASPFEKDDTVIDLGTGTGIIPLLIALRSEVQVIVACEVSREAARIARKNISSNKLSDRITLRTCDYRELAFFYPEGSFSV
ncbi:MAG: tRNA (adenine(22)-N(1))-methyltransferase TrmK, partial [Deltaproteobacteria bacterium]|nr:tRNA (adenine(22)-N(1))-methyltransferase TrmK [Deltaproteobacteria bacterium]